MCDEDASMEWLDANSPSEPEPLVFDDPIGAAELVDREVAIETLNVLSEPATMAALHEALSED